MNKVMLIFFIAVICLTLSCVNASDISSDSNSSGENYLSSDINMIQVDNASASTIKEALDIACDNGTVYLSDSIYKGDGNSKITIDKSVSIIGSDNTVIDGQNRNYLFVVSDNVNVRFKNIKFVNAYKSPESYYATYNNNVYGAAIDIKNATVTIEDCTFENSVLHYGSVDKYIYGGAISNFGDLTVVNSNFVNNTALSTSGLFSYGGSIYNKGKAVIRNSSFSKSKSIDFGYGAAIANDGVLFFDNGVIQNSVALQECKGSAIYNAGNFTLTNSIIKDNSIRRSNFNTVFGAVYNAGLLTGYGNIFKNNTAVYESGVTKGSPNIYTNGNLNLTYNAFIDNYCHDDISRDVYVNGGDITSLENNWWDTNNNPYEDELRVNVDEFSSWIMFKVTPDYSKLNISQIIILKAFLTNNIDNIAQISLLPDFNVTFSTNQASYKKQLVNGNANFIFNYTQNKGLYEVNVDLEGFTQRALVDVGKVLTEIRFNVSDNITYRDNLTVDVEVISPTGIPTGNVLLKIDGKTYILNLTDGRASGEISGLIPKDYKMEIIYDGDENYFKAFNDTTVHIQKQSVDLALTIPEIKVGQRGTAIATLLPSGVQGQAILYIDGVRKKIVYLYNGNTSIALNNFAEGQYNITLEFAETNYYYSKKASAVLNVTRYETEINITAGDIHVGENATVTVSVSPATLRGEATLIINGVSNEIFIDDTVTNITLSNLAGGQYNVTLIFEGDLRYYPVNVSTSFNVLKTPSSLTVDVHQNENDLNGTITVKTTPNTCSGVVGVYVNYNVYYLNLTKGSCEFKVTFDKGTNYIFVFYEGDEKYEGATWNTTLGIDDEFVFIGENSTGYQYNDFNYSIRLIELTGIPMPNREVSVSFNGEVFNITTNDDGYGYFKLNLPSGTYNITATYKNSTISNTIKVNDVNFNLTADNISYGDIEIIKAEFAKGIEGKVRFIIENNLEVICDITDSKAQYDLSGLKAGKYTVKAVYFNDLINITQSNTFEVSKSDLDLIVDIPGATPNDDLIINVGGLKNATGTLTFVVGGKTYNEQITDGKVILNLSKLNEGNYSVDISYGGDGNYDPVSQKVSFYVKQHASDLNISVKSAPYADDLIAAADLNSDATGTVQFIIGDLTKEVTIENGKAVYNFKGLEVGNYNLTVKYLGNDYYIDSSNSTSFSVYKANSTISMYVKEVALGENIRIYADLSPNATGSLSFSMTGYFSPRNKPISDSVATWYIAPMNTGEYEVIARYAGDKNYYSSDATFILNVTQKKSLMNVEINDVTITERVMCRITLYSNDDEALNSTVVLKVGTRSYNIDVKDGVGSMVLGRMAAGNYTYTVTYDGNENYTPASYNGIFRVVESYLDANLTANDFTKYYGGSDKMAIILKDSNGNPFANQVITVKIASKQFKVTTNSKGIAYADINLASGDYIAEITFSSNERYRNISANVSVSVLPTVEGMDVVKLYGTATQYFAIFTDSKGKALSNAKVTFKIGSKSYSISTLPNGIARINININPGTYTIFCKNPATGESLSNKIVIYSRIMENKDVSNYYGAKTNYKVRIYSDNAAPVGAGKTVTFKVNGKTYKVKTDKNGYAKLAVKLPAKKYTVTASYGKVKVSNKITVKKVLSAKNISKKKSKTTKFSAKLVNSAGKVLKGKKITFKINGKKYTAKTNKKGIATVTIKMNLKVGKHKIKSVYGKTSITNTITVKK